MIGRTPLQVFARYAFPEHQVEFDAPREERAPLDHGPQDRPALGQAAGLHLLNELPEERLGPFGQALRLLAGADLLLHRCQPRLGRLAGLAFLREFRLQLLHIVRSPLTARGQFHQVPDFRAGGRRFSLHPPALLLQPHQVLFRLRIVPGHGAADEIGVEAGLGELFLHVAVDFLRVVRWQGASPRLQRAGASVIEIPPAALAVRGVGGQVGAAEPTVQEAVEQVLVMLLGRAARSAGDAGIGVEALLDRLPEPFLEERLMRGGVDAAGPDLAADVGGIPQGPQDAAVAEDLAVAAQPLHQVVRVAAGQVEPEEFGHELARGGIRLQTALPFSHAIAERSAAADVPAAGGGGEHGLFHALGDQFALELGEERQQVPHQSAQRRGGVEVLRDEGEVHVVLVGHFPELEEVVHVAVQAVDLERDEDVERAGLEIGDHAAVSRPVIVLAAESVVAVDLHHARAAGLGPLPAALLLVLHRHAFLGLRGRADAEVDRGAENSRFGSLLH